jgi:hypothetical protein
MHYTLRKARVSDCEPMMRIGHESLRPYIEQLWGWDAEDQQRQFRVHFESESISIIQFNGSDVGYFKVDPPWW